jgi:hypothetical protein
LHGAGVLVNPEDEVSRSLHSKEQSEQACGIVKRVLFIYDLVLAFFLFNLFLIFQTARTTAEAMMRYVIISCIIFK